MRTTRKDYDSQGNAQVGCIRAEFVVVSQLGPRPIQKMRGDGREANLLMFLAAWRKGGRKTVFTNGCFDLLHPGHVESLRRAKAEADVLVVGLNSDRSVREIKGNGRPIMPEKARAEMLAALEMVDSVVIFDEPTAEEVLKVVRPDVFVKDEACRERARAECELVASWGGRVVLHPSVAGWSTSGIIEKIRGLP